MAKRPDNFRGFDITSPANRISAGRGAMAVNVRAYGAGQFNLRNPLTSPISIDSTTIHLDSSIQSFIRMNDTTPAGPSDGYVLISETATGRVYVNNIVVASGLTGHPTSNIPFRPNTSVRVWDYIGDDAPYPNVVVDSSFNCAGMIKVSSTGVSRKVGIEEPQTAPTVTFPGGGSGSSLIFYYYTYRASETGAVSNPSPVSIPGTNAQSDPAFTQTAAAGGVINPNITVNLAQYEGNGTQIRTKGSVGPGVVTDYIICRNFGFALPANVTISGVQIDLNWIGQSAGTGLLSGVALYYLSGQLGNVKFPGIQNQGTAIDTLQGGSADTWGAALTPAIINDPTFGFGVQITTQSAGGSDRSFVDTMGVTIFYSTQDANITPAISHDPQVDKIDFYRQGGGLANPTYVGTGPNQAIPFNDLLSDLSAADNQELSFANFEPFPSIDLPRQGTLNAALNVLTHVGGDLFNLRWLPGTIMLIGYPDQVAYTAPRRPSTPTSWDFTNNDPTVPTIPNGTNLTWNIAEPDLAAQPLAYLFGPTDNISYAFGVGDPLRPGTLYWCSAANLDAAPDTNQLEVTDPSEVLVNGAMSGGLGVLFSIKRAWVILPNFFNALATVTGTEGSTWTLQATSITRGLYIPRCLAVSGGGLILFRVDDGVHISRAGSISVSITDEDLYPLFPHESTGTGPTAPQPITRNGITIYPPDDSKPEMQKFQVVGNYLYYDAVCTDSLSHTFVYDIINEGWVWDLYNVQATAHATNEGESVQGTLVGCIDGTIRLMAPNGAETVHGSVLTPAIGGAGWQFAFECTVEYSSTATVLLAFIAADVNNGSYAPNSVTLPSTAGEITKYTFKLSPNKWKLLWMQFSSTDTTMAVYLEGFILQVKAWGDKGAFRPISPFRPSGGHGAQP